MQHLTKDKPIEKAPLPKMVVIPLAQHNGIPAKPIVEPNDRVKKGTKIGEIQGNISANIHSSISGVVKCIEPRVHPAGGNVLSVVIESDLKDECESRLVGTTDVESLTPLDIVDRVREAGIVGLGENPNIPTHLSLRVPMAIGTKQSHYDFIVILNGYECEPFITGDYRLMLECPNEIMLGGKLIMKALGAKKGCIAINDAQQEAISKFKSIAPKFGFEVRVLPSKYPQGEGKMLIHAITGREVPSDGSSLDVGVYVQDVGTAIAIYEACCIGKPLIERVVTVTGDVNQPKNLTVRIGTLFKDLIEFCGAYTAEPEKIIMGGHMKGIAQISADVPVIKDTFCILVQAKTSLPLDEPCIRCGSCIETCAMRLLPNMIADYIASAKFEQAKELGVLDCIECGVCAWGCPSKRNLIHFFKYGKMKLHHMAKA